MSSKQRAILAQAAERYHANNHQTSYFKDRGIDAGKFKLGSVTNPVTGHEPYVGMLSIPYYTPDGECVALRFKCMKQHDCEQYEHSRYNDLPGTEVRMYNTVDIADTTSKTIAVCQNELDTMILSGTIGLPAVGVSGVTNWRDYYARVFEDYTHVLIFGEGDRDGKAFTNTVARGLYNAVPIAMPSGKDLTELYREGGEQSVKELYKELI